ncbi:MAG: hypothetical protein FJ110_00460 [Deltaproteobacteria bacterium]|nr:hypothetical protein [Deltaproteobacteria bacterium]
MKNGMEKAEVEKILKSIEAHPLTQKIKEEEAAKILEERLLTAAKLRQAREEAERFIPQYEADLAKAEADLREYDEGRTVVLEKANLAKKKLAEERGRLDREKSEAEGALLGNYDPAIDEAIQFFRDRHEALLRKSPNKQTHEGGTDAYTLTKKLTTFSSLPAIRSALGYCRAAIEELEKAKLIPELDFDRIEKLKVGIPDTEVYTEVTTEKPLPGINADPRSLLPSDNEMEWSLGKLNEKFKKIMRK